MDDPEPIDDLGVLLARRIAELKAAAGRPPHPPPPLYLPDWLWANMGAALKASTWAWADAHHGGRIMLTGAYGETPSLLRRDA